MEEVQNVTPEQEAPATKTLAEKISTATLDNYKELLTEVAKVTDPILKEAHVSTLAKAIKVPKQLLNDALKEADREVNGEWKASFPELIDLVLTDKHQVAYLVLQDGIPNVVDQWKAVDGQTFVPPEQKHIPFKLGLASKVLEHFRNDNDRALVDDILKYVKRFSYLPDREWVVITTSILLSYLQSHPEVRFVPVLYFYAVAERGKSRTAKSMLSIMYRGIHLVDVRPANIVRYAQNFNASMFFDCTEIWRSAGKNDGEDILLGRFEKGTTVTRVLAPEAGPFKDQVSFEVFGSTIVATNEPANVTFESRCLTISMPNRPGEYEDSTPEHGIDLKERMIAFRARNMTRTLPKVAAIPGISGRLWDISRPLFQLCELFYPEGTEPMKELLIEMAGKKIEVKKGTLEGKIVAAIVSLVNFDGETEATLKFEEITKIINAGMPDLKKYSPQRLGRVVESLGIKHKSIRGYSHITIGDAQLETLKVQYGLAEEVVDTPQPEPSKEQPVTAAEPASKPKVIWDRQIKPVDVATEGDKTEIQPEKPEVESGSVLPSGKAIPAGDGAIKPVLPQRPGVIWAKPQK
jgi:hypothetical protein